MASLIWLRTSFQGTSVQVQRPAWPMPLPASARPIARAVPRASPCRARARARPGQRRQHPACTAGTGHRCQMSPQAPLPYGRALACRTGADAGRGYRKASRPLNRWAAGAKEIPGPHRRGAEEARLAGHRQITVSIARAPTDTRSRPASRPCAGRLVPVPGITTCARSSCRGIRPPSGPATVSRTWNCPARSRTRSWLCSRERTVTAQHDCDLSISCV